MIDSLLSSGASAAVTGYEGLVGMFGSPAMLAAMAGLLIVAAMIELYVRNCRKQAKEAV